MTENTVLKDTRQKLPVVTCGHSHPLFYLFFCFDVIIFFVIDCVINTLSPTDFHFLSSISQLLFFHAASRSASLYWSFSPLIPETSFFSTIRHTCLEPCRIINTGVRPEIIQGRAANLPIIELCGSSSRCFFLTHNGR